MFSNLLAQYPSFDRRLDVLVRIAHVQRMSGDMSESSKVSLQSALVITPFYAYILNCSHVVMCMGMCASPCVFPALLIKLEGCWGDLI